MAILYWSLTTQKSEIIISSGVVEGVNKNYIMVPYSGRISTLCIEEGQYVEEGELVLTVQNMEIDLQTAQLENQKKLCNNDLISLKNCLLQYKRIQTISTLQTPKMPFSIISLKHIKIASLNLSLMPRYIKITVTAWNK